MGVEVWSKETLDKLESELNEQGENVKFKRRNRGIDIVLDYEVRVPLISNLELIASFKKEVELND